MPATGAVQAAADNRARAIHADRFPILTVCTANICRSPLVELLLRKHLETSVYEVASAGIRGFTSRPMDPDAALQAVRFGTDPENFRSRPITADMINVSGLILTATREHRSSVLGMAPTALRRTFTLLEFGQLIQDSPASSLKELVALASRHRGQAKGDLDVGDPYRRGDLVHQQVAEKVVTGVDRVSEVLNEFATRDDAARG